MTPMKCKNGHKWRAHDMHDIWCRECGDVGVIDAALIERQRVFDAREHMMIDRVTGQAKGRPKDNDLGDLAVTWYRPDAIRDYCIPCTRGSSSSVINVLVQARSADDARAKLRQHGYDPVF